MRALLSLLALGTCLMGSGCSPILRGIDNVGYESRRWLDECHEKRRNRQFADKAWKCHLDKEPEICKSPDFSDGFKAGYADYLYAGGDGQGPPLPPRRYWTVSYQNPEGHKLIEQWYNGFKIGASVAKTDGIRDHIVVPPNAPLTWHGPPGVTPILAAPQPVVESTPTVPSPPPTPISPRPTEILPTPQLDGPIPIPPTSSVTLPERPMPASFTIR